MSEQVSVNVSVSVSELVGESVTVDTVQAWNFQSHKQSAGWRERRPSSVRSNDNTYRPLAVFFGVVVAHVHDRVVEDIFDEDQR